MSKCNISLYGIVDPEHSLGRDLAEISRISVDSGVTLVQYRDKVSGVREMIENASRITDALAGSPALFIVNDRVDVALASGAHGVHLGQEDMKVSDARKLLGDDAIIGLSVKTMDDARSCPVDLVDYVFIGGVFTTTSKDNPSAIGLEAWKERAQIIRRQKAEMPIGAIAGIDHSNAGEVMAAGCDGIAVISAIYRADDVATATRNLLNAMRKPT